VCCAAGRTSRSTLCSGFSHLDRPRRPLQKRAEDIFWHQIVRSPAYAMFLWIKREGYITFRGCGMEAGGRTAARPDYLVIGSARGMVRAGLGLRLRLGRDCDCDLTAAARCLPGAQRPALTF
jgi:hypothetical protein